MHGPPGIMLNLLTYRPQRRIYQLLVGVSHELLPIR